MAQPAPTAEQIAKAQALSDAYNQAKDAGQTNNTTPDAFLADANATQAENGSPNWNAAGAPANAQPQAAPQWAIDYANSHPQTVQQATTAGPPLPPPADNSRDWMPDPVELGKNAKANPVANPLVNGNADTSAVAPPPHLDPTALLKMMGGSKGGVSGPSALDKLVSAEKSETGEKLSALDQAKQANLLAASGEQQKNAVVGDMITQGALDSRTETQKNADRLQAANDQANQLQANAQKQIDDLRNAKIDPQRVWHNMNTGDKVRTMISIMLGGFVQGWTNGKVGNVGMDHLNDLIKQDTDEQMSELQNRKQSIQDTMQLNAAGFSRATATHAAQAQATLQKYALTKDMISGEASKYDNPKIQAAADQANAALDEKASDVRTALATQIYQADSAKERAAAAAAAAQQAHIQKVKDKAAELVDKGVQPEEAMRTSIYLNTGINTDPSRELATVEKPFEKAGAKTQLPVNVVQADGSIKAVIARNPDELKQLQALSTLNGLSPQLTGGKSASTYGEPVWRGIQGTQAFDNSQLQNRWNAQILGMVHAKNPAARSVEALNLIGQPYLIGQGDSKATIQKKVAAAQKDFSNTDMGSGDGTTTNKSSDDDLGFAAIK